MTNGDFICPAHEGHEARVRTLERETKEQWESMSKIADKVGKINDNINKNMNRILGGIAVACILLALNIALSYLKLKP